MPELKPDHLIIRYLSNEASAAEQEQLFEWVSRNAENQKIFNEYITAWSTQKDHEQSFDSVKALEKLNAKIDVHEKSETERIVFWNRWNIAAAIVFLIVSGFILFHTGRNAYQMHVESSLAEFVSSDTLNKITLSDGSVITLNANSVLKYPEVFAVNNREVYLTGEAFFEITKDASKPFIVHTEDISTHVIGTSFNILATEGKTVVSVATGGVKVSDGTTTELLKPYEKVTYALNSFTKKVTNLSELDWNDRTLKFEDTPLEEAIKKLERHYGIKIVLENEALKKCAITGKFKNEPLVNVLQAIEYSLGTNTKQVKDTITLSGKGCH